MTVLLITGGTGLVGRTLARAAHAADWAVWTVGRRPMAGRHLIADLRSAELGTIAPRPDVVVHAAAVVPTTPAEDTLEAAAETRALDQKVARAAGRWCVPTLYVSTCGLYDPTDPEPKVPDSPLRPRSPYFSAKLAGEQLFGAIGATIVRISSVAGPGMSSGGILPRFVACARAANEIEVWGSGSREQDFLHVDDLASGVLAALSAGPGQTLNLASGHPTTMRELADAVVRVVGTGSVASSSVGDPNEGHTARYDISLAVQRLGWAPSRGLDEIIASVGA